jgi:hypothetical protein
MRRRRMEARRMKLVVRGEVVKRVGGEEAGKGGVVKVSAGLRRQNERRGEWEGVDSQIQKSTRWFLEPSQICRVAKEAALRPAASPPPPSPPPSCFFSRA